MLYLCTGILAFFLYYIYDLNSVCFHTRFFKSFFTIGSLLLAVSTVKLIWRAAKSSLFSEFSIVSLCLAFIFLALLIYTLFFALPFKKTYGQSDSLPSVVHTTGMYAICRHPGVLWLSGFYFCTALSFQSLLLWAAALIFSLLDIIYVILQDYYIFPKQFEGYAQYKDFAPFLLPNSKSLQRAAKTWRIGDTYHEI